MKFRIPEILFGALLAVAIFAMGMLFSSHRPENNSAPNKNQENTETNRILKAADDRIADYTLALDVLTFVLAAATIGLGIVGGIGIRNQTRDIRIIQRAYIAVDGDGVQPLVADALKRSIAHVKLRNVGHLPAGEVKWFIDTAVSDDGRRNQFPIGEKFFFGKNTMPPGTDMRRSQYFAISEAEYNGITKSHSILYVWGEVRYLDGFGNQKFTRFCHRYDRRGHKQTEIHPTRGRAIFPVYASELTAESMRYHQYGNDAD